MEEACRESSFVCSTGMHGHCTYVVFSLCVHVCVACIYMWCVYVSSDVEHVP